MQRILFISIVSIIVIACNPNNNRIIPVADLSNIIVKEKNISGVFVTQLEYKLFYDSDSIFFDSIQTIDPITQTKSTMVFDFNNYSTKNYLVIKYNNQIDSANAEILKFTNGKVVAYLKYYDLKNDDATNSEVVDFTSTDSILYAVTTRQLTPDQNLYHFSLDAFSQDSMHVFSINTETFAPNFEYTSYFLNKQNNTNSLLLSGFIPTDFDKIPFFGSYIPFPKLNMKLVNSTRHFGTLSPNVVYTFDSNNRVKTATFNNTLLIEYNY